MTSRLVAACRERESQRADRLFDDPLAGPLAGDEGRALMATLEAVPRQMDVRVPTENPYLAIRTRFMDDAVARAIKSGIRQFAILAAGMDARAFRLNWPPDAVIYEVERSEVLDYKESVLKRLSAKPLANRILVAMDLSEDFPAAMQKAGFQSCKPTFFLTEGLLPYLPGESSVEILLNKIASIASSGSMIALDTVSQSFLESHWTRQFLELMSREGSPWQFGTDTPEQLLERTGFTNVQVTQPGDFLPERWPFPSLARSVPGVPRSFLVTAHRATVRG